ncbi:MAG: hypothetical protein ABII09_02605, partial [Planctomycetota bacterium]
MAGMFYSIKEVSEKLGKSEDEVRQLVKAGRLREFRDGPNLLFKVDEVTALMSDTGVMQTSKQAEKSAEPKSEEKVEVDAEPILEEEPEAESAPTPEVETPVEPMLEAEPEAESAPTPEVETPVEPELVEEPQLEQPAAPAPQTEAEAEEILLAPEGPEKPGEEIHLTDADTQIVDEGIKVLGETDTAESLGGDTGGETFKGLSGTPAPGKEASLEEIEKDVSL